MSQTSKDDDQYYSYGEAPVKASISTPQNATGEELVAIARQIWKRVTESKIDKNDDAGNDQLLEAIQTDFKDFNVTFPLVLRWMVQLRKFSNRAFEKYLLKYSSTKIDSRESFLELQAEYLVYLYREEHRHPDENAVRKYRAGVIKQLVDEDKLFLELHKQVEKDLEADIANIDKDRRRRLYEYILAKKVAVENSS